MTDDLIPSTTVRCPRCDRRFQIVGGSPGEIVSCSCGASIRLQGIASPQRPRRSCPHCRAEVAVVAPSPCPHCAVPLNLPLPKVAERLWFWARNQQTNGPYSLEQLAKLIQVGHLTQQDMLLRDGAQKWTAAEKFWHLFVDAMSLDSSIPIALAPDDAHGFNAKEHSSPSGLGQYRAQVLGELQSMLDAVSACRPNEKALRSVLAEWPGRFRECIPPETLHELPLHKKNQSLLKQLASGLDMMAEITDADLALTAWNAGEAEVNEQAVRRLHLLLALVRSLGTTAENSNPLVVTVTTKKAYAEDEEAARDAERAYRKWLIPMLELVGVPAVANRGSGSEAGSESTRRLAVSTLTDQFQASFTGVMHKHVTIRAKIRISYSDREASGSARPTTEIEYQDSAKEVSWMPANILGLGLNPSDELLGELFGKLCYAIASNLPEEVYRDCVPWLGPQLTCPQCGHPHPLSYRGTVRGGLDPENLDKEGNDLTEYLTQECPHMVVCLGCGCNVLSGLLPHLALRKSWADRWLGVSRVLATLGLLIPGGAWGYQMIWGNEPEEVLWALTGLGGLLLLIALIGVIVALPARLSVAGRSRHLQYSEAIGENERKLRKCPTLRASRKRLEKLLRQEGDSA